MDAEGALRRKLQRMGPSRAVNTLLSKYGNVGTKLVYLYDLSLYFDFLKEKGIVMTPDELVKDNLECIFRSDPTDVITKSKHTSWLDEYVNRYLIEKDCLESRRRHATAAVRAFYKRNNSPLFGDFAVSSQPTERPARPLFTEDIRLVLKALPLPVRTPLLITWQSGLEPLKVYSTKFATDQTPPVKVELFGRKLHRKPYITFLGKDSVDHLRMLRAKGFPTYWNVRMTFRDTAKRLAAKGLLKNGDRASWHPYMLRHSFSTECSHAGVNREVREYFMGHTSGIAFVYQHPEMHEEDLLAEYSKVEPFVSLDYNRAVAERETESRDRELIRLVRELQEKVARMESAQASSSASQAPP